MEAIFCYRASCRAMRKHISYVHIEKIDILIRRKAQCKRYDQGTVCDGRTGSWLHPEIRVTWRKTSPVSFLKLNLFIKRNDMLSWKIRIKELLEMSHSCRFSETSGRVLGRARDIEARGFAYIRNTEAEVRAGIISSTMQPASRFCHTHTYTHAHKEMGLL
jgi:hypothetical protein